MTLQISMRMVGTFRLGTSFDNMMLESEASRLLCLVSQCVLYQELCKRDTDLQFRYFSKKPILKEKYVSNVSAHYNRSNHTMHDWAACGNSEFRMGKR